MAEKFATLIAEVRVDDTGLKPDLARGEKVIRDSASRMEKSLSKVSIANSRVSATSFDAAKGLSAFSSSAGALGGTLGGVIGQIAAGIQSLVNLTSSLGGLAGALGLGAAITGAGLMISKIITLRSETARLAVEFEEASRAAKQVFEASQGKAAQALVDDSKTRTALLLSKAAERDDPEAARRARDRDRLRVLADRERRIGIEQDEQGTENANRRARVLAAIEAERAAIRLNRTSERRAKNEAETKKILEAQTKEQQRQAVLAEAATKAAERVRAIQNATTRGVAQALAIQAGINQPSDFVSDPTQRHLTRLMERLSSAQAGGGLGGVSGTIGSRAALNLSERNLALNPQFGSQKVSSEKKQDVANKLLREIKQALSTLNTGAV